MIAVLVALSMSGNAASQEGPKPTNASAAKQGPHLFVDDSLFFGYGPEYETPFVFRPGSSSAADIARVSVEFRHVDSWRLGDNLADISLRKSNGAEPSTGGGTGALEPYAIFRSSLSYNKVTQSGAMSRGPVRDISLEVGANLESKNSSFAPEERTIYVGPVVQVKVPRGFLNVGLHFRKEWNHEGVLGRNESYSPGFNLEPTWAVPFSLLGAKLTFDGFADLNTPKGNDSFGSPTHTEFITRPFLWMDLAPLLHGKPHVIEAGAGFEYWNNEYGKSAQTAPGAGELTPVFELKVHLPIANARKSEDKKRP